MSLQLAAASYIYIHYALKKKRKERRWWQRQQYTSREVYSGYRNAFSIVLFALVNAYYNFMFVDAGCQGRISDSGVFTNTELYKKLETKTLGLPQPVPLNGREIKCSKNFNWR
jgi:hypothetical protein